MGIKLFLILTSICNTVFATDTQPLIQSASVSPIEYEAFLKMNTQFKPVSEELASQRTYEVSSQKLPELFDEAEKSFLSEPVEVAHDKYKQVIRLALKSDWSDSERKLIFHAFLRMAQTAVNAEKRSEYLIQSRQLDSKLKPDDNLFPPPLIKDWEALQAKDIFKIVQLNKSFAAYNVAFVNGKRIDFKRFTLLVPKGDFRLTLFSNSRAPYTKILNAEKIKYVLASSAPLATGDCNNPKFNKALSAAALYPDDCVSYGLKAKNGSLTKSDLGEFNEKSVMQNRIEARTNFESRPFYKSGVFWTAAAAVAAYVIYKQNENDRDGSPATHKTGF
jgi:hypothetical protein